MASLFGAVTTLGLLGLSQAAPVLDTEYGTSPRPYTITFTQLTLNGGPAARNVDFSGKVEGSTATPTVTDTAYLSATEGPIDTNEIATYDSANLTATELANLLNFYGVSDGANLTLNEAIALNITGITTKTGTDTANLTLTETPAVGVTVDVTDDASLTLSGETSSVDVSTEVLTATDDAAISVEDSATLTVFAGNASFNVDDTVMLQLAESAVAAPVIDTEVVAIKFLAKVPTIRFRKL